MLMLFSFPLHHVMLDQPEAFAAQVDAFLK
jgi:hypothetical protein